MADSQSQIAVLAEQIANGTDQINSYLQSHGLPTPSFNVDGPNDLGPTKELQDTRATVVGATQELQELLPGPGMLIHITQQAKERDLEEWESLLAGADSRFRLHEARQLQSQHWAFSILYGSRAANGMATGGITSLEMIENQIS